MSLHTSSVSVIPPWFLRSQIMRIYCHGLLSVSVCLIIPLCRHTFLTWLMHVCRRVWLVSSTKGQPLMCSMQNYHYHIIDFVFCFLREAPELVLRKVINFADCTVCLDKRNASGKIEFYQDPLLYKCSFRTRLHFTYDNINSKIPSVIKVSSSIFFFSKTPQNHSQSSRLRKGFVCVYLMSLFCLPNLSHMVVMEKFKFVTAARVLPDLFLNVVEICLCSQI